MKKIYLAIMFGIFLISLASAFDWTDGRLVSYYNFDQGTGTFANDSSGHNNNGTLINTPEWVGGIINGALNFSNISAQYVNFTSTNEYNVSGFRNFSISVWIYPNSSTGTFVIASKQENWIVQQEDLKLRVLFLDNEDSAYHNFFTTDNTVLNVGVWQHVVFSYNGTGDFCGASGFFAINGTVVPTTIGQGHSPCANTTNNPGNFRIGKHPTLNVRNFNGGIDELGFFNRTLSMSEIKQLYNNGLGLGYGLGTEIVNVNSEIIPSGYYELETMTNGRFFINVSNNSYINLTANIVYNGTIFPTVQSVQGSFFSFERNITHSFPDTTAINYYWNFTITNSTGNYTQIYDNTTQVIGSTVLSICNGIYTTPYINYTFKDESTLTALNITITSASFIYWLNDSTYTKTLTYSNSSLNYNYAFCFSPSTRSVHITPDIQYSSTGYPQRSYASSNILLTNSLTNTTLYLLGSADGIYVTFITSTTANTPISGANINIVRTISGTNITLASGVTDSAGSLTAWLNPNYDNYVTASKTGYGITTQVIRPTQSTYTIILSSSLNTYTFVNDYAGLKWFVFPSVGSRDLAAATNFGFNISAQNDNLIACRIDLLNNNKTVILSSAETNTTNSSLCSVYTSYIMTDTDYKVKGRLLVDVGSGYQLLEDDAYWIYQPYNTTNATLTDWFNGLKDLDLSYFNNNEQHREYTYILLFFLFVTLVCAVMNYAGWDIQTAGGMIYLVGILIFAASIPGFLNLSGISPFSWMDKYFVAIVYSMFMIGFTMRQFT